MIRTLHGLEPQGGDVSQVCALWLLVHGALVESGVLGRSGVYCVHVHHRQQSEEYLGLGLDQLTATAIPPSAIQVQTIDVNAFL